LELHIYSAVVSGAPHQSRPRSLICEAEQKHVGRSSGAEETGRSPGTGNKKLFLLGKSNMELREKVKGLTGFTKGNLQQEQTTGLKNRNKRQD